jgi:hypothetical protein
MLGAGDLADLESLARQYQNGSQPIYLVISSGMKVYCHVFGALPDRSLDSLDTALASSLDWRLFYRNDDAVVYELVAREPSQAISG